MKNIKRIFARTLTTLALTLSCSFAAIAGQQHGGIDSVQGNTVSGWVVNLDAPDHAQTVSVEITSEGGQTVKKLTVLADRVRNEGVSVGNSNQKCGFLAPMNWEGLADGTYTVSASANGETFGTPVVYRKGAPALRSLGVFRTTGYCPCLSCSEGWGRKTSTGAIAQAGHTIAVDPRVIPIGTKVMINGVIYTAEDKGGGVKGNHVDIFVDTHGETKTLGSDYAEVFIVG